MGKLNGREPLGPPAVWYLLHQPSAIVVVLAIAAIAIMVPILLAVAPAAHPATVIAAAITPPIPIMAVVTPRPVAPPILLAVEIATIETIAALEHDHPMTRSVP